jgi:hypothetical protein
MMMTWYLTTVYYFGIFDAGIILIAGALLATIILIDAKTDEITGRVIPAIVTLVLSNVAAMAVLGMTRWWIS